MVVWAMVGIVDRALLCARGVPNCGAIRKQFVLANPKGYTMYNDE